MTNPLSFSCSNLSKTFRHRKVVQDVSLEINVGEAVGLLGPNGAGKTTCFLMMAGLEQPDSGKIFLGGLDVTLWPLYQKARKGVRYLPQESSIFRGMTVEENLMAVLELFVPNPKERHEKLESLLQDFRLSEVRKSSALVLSGGERRRVEIARALVGNPHFLLLDEPLSGIDPKSIGEIRDLVGHLKERKVGVLITDHNVRDTLRIVDRAYIIHDGYILKEGKPQELIKSSRVRSVYLGDSFTL